MAKASEIVDFTVNLLHEHGMQVEINERDRQRVIKFTEDLGKGYVDNLPSDPTLEQIQAWANTVRQDYDTMGEPITMLFITFCVTVSFLYGQSKNTRFLQETIESIGKAGREILDAEAAKDLLNFLRTLLGNGGK